MQQCREAAAFAALTLRSTLAVVGCGVLFQCQTCLPISVAPRLPHAGAVHIRIETTLLLKSLNCLCTASLGDALLEKKMGLGWLYGCTHNINKNLRKLSFGGGVIACFARVKCCSDAA